MPVKLRMLLPPVVPGILSETNVDDVSLEDKANHMETLKEDFISAFPVRQGNASWAKKDAIFDVLHALRETAWRDNAVYGVFTPYTASALLPDEVILAIARRCDMIQTTEDIDAVLVHYTQRSSKSHPLIGIVSQRIFQTLLPVITSFRTSTKHGVRHKSYSQHVPFDNRSLGTQSENQEQYDVLLEVINTEAPQIHQANGDLRDHR